MVTRHRHDDLSEEILMLSSELDEFPGSVAGEVAGESRGAGRPLTINLLGKVGESLTEKSWRSASTESISGAEVEAWAGPILPATVGWIAQLLRLLLGILLGGWGAWGLHWSSILHKEEDLTLPMSVASERRAARGCHASSGKSLIGLDVPDAEPQTGEFPVDPSTGRALGAQDMKGAVWG